MGTTSGADRLHPALQPAGPLPDPLVQGGRCFLPCGRCEYGGVQAAPRHAKAEVGILGDVEGIPAADGNQRVAPEVVRRAAKRDGKAKTRERGQDGIKQR